MEEFYGTIDATNGLEMNESFIHNNWESGDLLMVTKNDNGTIIFAKVTVNVEFKAWRPAVGWVCV